MMNPAEEQKWSLRYERKFFVSDLSQHEVGHIVRNHPAMFREVFPARQVNNIYFDTPDARHWRDNVNGLAERTKVRLRWYGETFGAVTKPTLQVKGKRGVASWKESYPAPSLVYSRGPGFDIRSLLREHLVVGESARARFETLDATLLNSYQRQYYLSTNEKFRLTIDVAVTFHRVGRAGEVYLENIRHDDTVIVELKYGPDSDATADEVSSKLPFLVTKSSKYAIGMGCLNGES